MRSGSSGGAGLAMGVAIGVALGAAMDNIGAGIAIGVAIGLAWGGAQRRTSNTPPPDRNEATSDAAGSASERGGAKPLG